MITSDTMKDVELEQSESTLEIDNKSVLFVCTFISLVSLPKLVGGKLVKWVHVLFP